MLRERAVGCGARQLPGPPRVACETSREDVDIIHARRHPCCNVTPSYAAVWPAPCAPERPPKPLSPCDASITRPAPVITSATGSRLIRPRRPHSATSWPLSWWAVTSMPQPEKARGRPPGRRPGNRPDEKAPASADHQPQPGPVCALSARRKRRSAPPMRVSLFEPAGRRTQWWFTGGCLPLRWHIARPGEARGGRRRCPPRLLRPQGAHHRGPRLPPASPGGSVSADAASLLEALPDPLAEAEYRRRLSQEAFERGRALGDHEGYERASADLAAGWHVAADPASRGGESCNEYELRRWGQAGRAHFGDPRPADLTPAGMLTRARASWEPLGLTEPGIEHLA